MLKLVFSHHTDQAKRETESKGINASNFFIAAKVISKIFGNINYVTYQLVSSRAEVQHHFHNRCMTNLFGVE